MRLPEAIGAKIDKVLSVLGEDAGPIWLFGSRANGTARDDSDWDFLAFSNDAGFRRLREQPELKSDSIDLLVVADGERFADPWPAGGETPKSGFLSMWQWQQIGPETAEYTVVKYDGPWWRPGSERPERLAAHLVRRAGAGA